MDTTAAHLLIEAGPAGISFVITDRDNCFCTVIVYAFPFDLNVVGIAEKMEAVIHAEPLLQKQFKKTDITWAFPESILVPNEWMNTAIAGEMIDLVYGDLNKGDVRSDFMFRYDLHNVYRIPQPVSDVFSKYFLFASQTHQYSLLPELHHHEGDHLYVIFYNNSLTVMLHKEGKLQVIQNFHYKSPEDAGYHLLNVCSSFDVPADRVVLQLSGMTDLNSPLYAALYKYFLTIQFETLPANVLYNEAIKNYPEHFFSHLFEMAICV